MESSTGIRDFYEYGNCARFLLPEIFDLAAREGIFRRLGEVSPFTFDGFCEALEKDPGYSVSAGNRRRMIRVLLDLIREAGWIDHGSGGSVRMPEEAGARVEDAQILFFRECLRHVPAFLRGDPAPFGFDGKSAAIWDRFLGCSSFRSCRKMLMELMGVENSPAFRLLDLCHGPGWGLADAVASYPEARVTAVDFTDSFARMARERVNGSAGQGSRSPDIRWIDPCRWKGFGNPLPLDDGAFDAVLFSCGDPYIPKAIRKDVYREISRVLVSGGRLGILTRAYPDADHLRVPSSGVRIATLVHDFSEGVCAGWEGFSGLDENSRMFEEIGYREGAGRRGRTNFLDGTLWVLTK
jgi:ubiquinone/menaquinone biosynthesis C-methylase UbiE